MEQQLALVLREAKGLGEGRRIHALLVSRGSHTQTLLANLLVLMYGRCGEAAQAAAVFHATPRKNTFSWNIAIAASPAPDAFPLFLSMLCEQERGQGAALRPDKFTFLPLVAASAALRSLPQGKQSHAFAVSNGGFLLFSSSSSSDDPQLANSLLNMYSKCGRLSDARRLFDCMGCSRDLVSWSSMISAYAQQGHWRESLDLFFSSHSFMGSDLYSLEFEPDRVMYASLLDACSSIGLLGLGKGFHGRIVDSGIKSDTTLATALLTMYGKCGRAEDARRVFDQMPRKDAPAWNAMLAAYVSNAHGDDALALWRTMRGGGLGLHPSRVGFLCVLDACADLASLKDGRKIHEQVSIAGLCDDSAVANALINMYGKCGSPSEARMIFDTMHAAGHSNQISWSAMIAAYAQTGHCGEALKLFHRMEFESDEEPNNITFLGILTACNNAGFLDEGRYYFSHMRDSYGLTPSVEQCRCMIDLLGRAGCLDEAEGLIKNMMGESDVLGWVTFLHACRINR